MKPKPFAEQNKVYVAENCGDLPVHQNDTQILSCWEFEGKEKLLVLFFGHIWLSVIGQQQPPVSLIAVNPFLDEHGKAPDFDLIINQFVERKVKQFLAPQEKDLDEKSRKFAESMLVAFLHFVFVSSEGE